MKRTNNFSRENFNQPSREFDKVVKKPQDKIYKKKDANSSYSNPSKIKENQEQPVDPIKNPPKQ